MKATRLVVFGTGLVIGYLAGSAAGRERYDQITGAASKLASDLGFAGLADQLAQRSGDVARATTSATRDVVDNTADRLTESVAAAAQHLSDTPSPVA